MMLTYPFAFYVSEALSAANPRSKGWFSLTRRKIGVYIALVYAILSLGFMLLPPESPMPYFDVKICNRYIYYVPSSMLQNTVSIKDCWDTVNALQWLKSNMHGGAILLTHRAFYGWAMLTLEENQIMLYEYENPAEVAEMVIHRGHSQIYLIWWISGEGWYGQPKVPSTFIEVYRSGRISVYIYGEES